VKLSDDDLRDDLEDERTRSAEESERRYRELLFTEHAGDSAERETRPQTGTSPAAPARRVLVAEDNRLSQQVLARQLATLGFVYDIVADGGEAFNSVTRGGYDVVLMDLQMPVLDGRSVARLIRQWEKENGAPPVKIVAVTASASADDRRRCLDIGMDDHLRKPLQIAVLSSVLSRLLDSPSSASFGPERSESGSHPELDHSMIEGLRALGEDDGTFLRGLIRQFRVDGDARLARLGRAAEDGDIFAIRGLAHALCGSSANIGAAGVTAACRAIEVLSPNDDASHYQSAVRRVRAAYDHVLPLLDGLA
jgi:CheY-like chemotaxis protein/HPt (histidine-containing phosphotransfer) domain-containing protein